MRKVEEKMLHHWRFVVTGKVSRNTELKYFYRCGSTWFGIFLFGNLIAYKTENGAMFSLAGYSTPTTLSRLRALGLNLKKKNGIVYRNGKEWRGDF